MKRLTAKFFCLTSGKEPVRHWLMGLDKEDRRSVGIAIKDCEYAWPIGLPLCRQISGHKGLWEIRCDITNKRIVRVMFIVDGNKMILLHGFIKKTQKTEQKEINLAVKRQKEYEANG